MPKKIPMHIKIAQSFKKLPDYHLPDPTADHTDVDIWSTDMLGLITESFPMGQDLSEEQTREKVHESECNLLNALREFYQMHR